MPKWETGIVKDICFISEKPRFVMRKTVFCMVKAGLLQPERYTFEK